MYIKIMKPRFEMFFGLKRSFVIAVPLFPQVDFYHFQNWSYSIEEGFSRFSQ